MGRSGILLGVMGIVALAGGIAWAQLDGPGGRLVASKPATSVTEVAGTSPTGDAAHAVNLDATIIQREGETLRLLNTVVRVPESKDVRHVDVSFKLTVDREGKVHVESVETKATTLIGVDALVAGTYVADNKQPYELKGPAFDVDMRGTWSIAGRNFNATVVAGPVAGNPQIGTLKGTEGLPEAGAYGLANHNQAFAGFQNSTKTLVNLRQVGDTLVIAAYGVVNGKYEQTGNVVLKRQ